MQFFRVKDTLRSETNCMTVVRRRHNKSHKYEHYIKNIQNKIIKFCDTQIVSNTKKLFHTIMLLTHTHLYV